MWSRGPVPAVRPRRSAAVIPSWGPAPQPVVPHPENLQHLDDHPRVIRRVALPHAPGPPDRTDWTFEHRDASAQHGEHLIDRPQRRHPEQEGHIVVVEMPIIAHIAPELAWLGGIRR